MATRLRVLIDLNIILDVLKRREPFYEKSAQILAAALSWFYRGLYRQAQCDHLNYILTKYLRTEK
jgi:hypothetical protein